MKKIFIVIATLFAVVSLTMAQTKPVSDVSLLKQKMQAAAAKVHSIQSAFTQEKYMSVMANTMKSTGKFFYEKGDKVKLEYVTPFKQNLVMNGNALIMEMNGKKNKLDATANPMAAELKKVISACMSGDINNIGQNYKMDFFEDGDTYLVNITPQTDDIKKFAEKVELRLDSKDFTVVKMKMIEPIKKGQKTNDYTEYTFSDKKMNGTIAPNVFAVK